MIVSKDQPIQEQIARTIVNEFFYQQSISCGNANSINTDVIAKNHLREMIVKTLSDPEVCMALIGSFK